MCESFPIELSKHYYDCINEISNDNNTFVLEGQIERLKYRITVIDNRISTMDVATPSISLTNKINILRQVTTETGKH